MTKEELKQRTKLFALRIINIVNALPKNAVSRTIANQLIRCGTSVGANYRASCRARSKKEFISKLGIVLEESDECSFWLELIIEAKLLKKIRVEPLLNESDELTAIFSSSIKTAKSSNKK
ncbi:four helix bundle protein [Candidatus Babeliales bacterium]|nr:four helix bundle protein [Candidatus Babeliales bacterium]